MDLEPDPTPRIHRALVQVLLDTSEVDHLAIFRCSRHQRRAKVIGIGKWFDIDQRQVRDLFVVLLSEPENKRLCDLCSKLCSLAKVRRGATCSLPLSPLLALAVLLARIDAVALVQRIAHFTDETQQRPLFVRIVHVETPLGGWIFSGAELFFKRVQRPTGHNWWSAALLGVRRLYHDLMPGWRRAPPSSQEGET